MTGWIWQSWKDCSCKCKTHGVLGYRIHDTMASSDLVAKWDVTLSDKVHRVEFEHGTTTGKRVIRVDGTVCELH